MHHTVLGRARELGCMFSTTLKTQPDDRVTYGQKPPLTDISWLLLGKCSEDGKKSMHAAFATHLIYIAALGQIKENFYIKLVTLSGLLILKIL